MARIKVRYLIERPGAAGTVRYFWSPRPADRAEGWRMVRLPDDQASAIAEAEKLNATLDAWRRGDGAGPDGDALGRPGTVKAAFAAYRLSPDFLELKAKTREGYDWCLGIIDAWAGPELVAAITPKSVQTLYRELAKTTPAKAAYVVRVISTLWGFGRRNLSGFPEANPAANQKLKVGTPGTRLWERDDVEAFVKAADALGLYSVGTAVVLNEWLGQRESDLLRLPRSAYKAGAIEVRQSKRGAIVELPVDLVPSLRTRLEGELARQAKRQVTATTLLVSDRSGRAWDEYGFRKAVAEIRARAALERPAIDGLTFMRLRHTAVTRLEEAGANWGWIASVTGHSETTIKTIIETYRVRTKKMARQAFELRLEKEQAK